MLLLVNQAKASNTISFVFELTAFSVSVVPKLPVVATYVPKAVAAEVVSTPENVCTPTILPPVVVLPKVTCTVFEPVISVGFKR